MHISAHLTRVDIKASTVKTLVFVCYFLPALLSALDVEIDWSLLGGKKRYNSGASESSFIWYVSKVTVRRCPEKTSPPRLCWAMPKNCKSPRVCQRRDRIAGHTRTKLRGKCHLSCTAQTPNPSPNQSPNPPLEHSLRRGKYNFACNSKLGLPSDSSFPLRCTAVLPILFIIPRYKYRLENSLALTSLDNFL